MDGRSNAISGSKSESKEYTVVDPIITASMNVGNQPFMLSSYATSGQTVVDTGFCKLVYPYKITITDNMGVGASFGDATSSSIDILKNILEPIELEDGSYIVEVIPCRIDDRGLTNSYRVPVDVLNSKKTITSRSIYGNIFGGGVLFVSGISKID